MRTRNGRCTRRSGHAGRRRSLVLAAASAVLTSSLALVTTAVITTTATPSAAADCARRYVAQGDGVPDGEDVTSGVEYPQKLLADHLQTMPGGTGSAPWCLYNTAADEATTDTFVQGSESQQSQAWNYKPSLITLQLGRQNSKIVDQIDSCFRQIKTFHMFPVAAACAKSILDDTTAWSKLQKDLGAILNTYKTQMAGNPNLVVAVLGYFNPYPSALRVLPRIPRLCIPTVDAAIPCSLWWMTTLPPALALLDQVVQKLNATIKPVVNQFAIASQGRYFYVHTYDKFKRHCTQMWVTLSLPAVLHPLWIDSHPIPPRPVNVGCSPLTSWIASDGTPGFFTPFHYLIPVAPPGIWLVPPIQVTAFMGVNPNDAGHECLSDLIWETVKNKLGVPERADVNGACSRFDVPEPTDSLTPSPSAADEQNPNPPVPPASALAQGHVAAGARHSCAVLANGGTSGPVQCWGNNDVGQLGNGSLTSSTVPVTVSGTSTATQIAAGNDHTCALLADGTVQCWGSNTSGQLGDGSTANRTTAVPVKGLTGVKSVTAGASFTCAVVSGGTAKCWGDNSAGQLGNGNLASQTAPAAVTVITTANPASAVSAGDHHACALLADGTVQCWGSNDSGQLGDETFVDHSRPAPVKGLPAPGANPTVALTAGFAHTCALLKDNSARCWGANDSGQLGFETPDANGDEYADPSKPGAVQYDSDPSASTEAHHTLFGITALAAGQSHTCALMADGSVRCWGANYGGQLGHEDSGEHSHDAGHPTAVVVPGLTGARALAAGSFHNCAIVGGGVKCWGYDPYAERPSSTSPVLVNGVSGAKVVTAGTGFVCALVDADMTNKLPAGTKNKPMCWGDNSQGQVGAAAPPGDSAVQAVSGIASADAIDAGNGQVCAVPAGTTSVQCWGRNDDGQVGNDSTTDQFSPAPVPGSVTTAISAGGTLDAAEHGHTCAVRPDGTVACWGSNNRSQLGDGTATARSSPVTVRIDTDPNPDHVALADLTGATSVVTGGSHSCAVASDHTVWCWGSNNHGQLGNNSIEQRSVATQVRTNADPNADHPLANVVALAAGADFTCAVLGTGGATCWGANGSGQLGAGPGFLLVEARLPVAVQGLAAAVTSITAGDTHVCAVLANDSLVCWGGNAHGQLGDGTTAASASPKLIMPTPPPTEHAAEKPVIRSISASRANTCVTRFDVRVTCWGDNSHGQLGKGAERVSATPVGVPLAGSV
jgi:alpha-tubulin suppressor-like RCC1 family protein